MSGPLRIALIMQGSRNWIAGSEYIKNIILALGNLPPEVHKTYEIYLLTSQDLNSNLLVQINPYVKKILNPKNEKNRLSILKRFRKKIQKHLFGENSTRLDFFLENFHFDFVYPYFISNPRKQSFRSAAWIPDFQHRYLPQFFDLQELQKRDNLFRQIANHSSTIILSSKTSQSDFIKFFPQASQKSRVLHFRVFPINDWYAQDPRQIQLRYNLPERFYLISNQFWQHKNHITVFKALKYLQEKKITPYIVCTGHLHDYRQADYTDTILKTIHELNISKQVFLLGLIPKSEQIQLLRRSVGMIQPSLFEGWSTVVEEAKLFGKPVILSDLTVNVEQNPPYSVFFKRNSFEDLSEKLTNWWDRFPAGPDLNQEKKSKNDYLKEVDIFAYTFLNIAKGE